MPRWRRVLALTVLLILVALCLEPQLVQLVFVDRKPLTAAFTARPDRLWPEYPRFIEGVRARTRNGDSIALVTPTLDWENGYSYAYYRASYLLAGREVLPVADSERRLHPENVGRAKYVAVWRRAIAPGVGKVVWQGNGGVLLRR